MNKMNKKGFTLIEMLVVIAIIAVLVAIIIPTVSNSTMKAKGAADAANMRSIAAEAGIDYLQNDNKLKNDYEINLKTDENADAVPVSFFTDKNGSLIAVVNPGAEAKSIEYFAFIAENGATSKDGKNAPTIKTNDQTTYTAVAKVSG